MTSIRYSIPTFSAAAILSLSAGRTLLLAALLCIFFQKDASAQCTLNSAGCGGYTVTISIAPLNVVPSATNCQNGYNYNVKFSYSISVSGINTCYNGDIGIQPQIICGNDNNGYYTISVPAPKVGDPATTSTYTGVITTSGNPFRAAADCNSATPASLNCNSLLINAYGPGLSYGAYPCSLAAALPIEISAFSAHCAAGNTVLEWITATENNNDYFTVERSADAIEWVNVGRIEGAGYSARRYNFSDVQTYKGDSYYRLKQTDYDGKYSYSPVVSVRNCQGTSRENDFSIYPNPAAGEFNLQFSGQAEDVRFVEVYNLMGLKILHQENYESSIDLSDKPGGNYIVNLVLNDQVISKKIMLK